MKAILHVGHQKCGSKSIQHYLSSNKAIFANNSVFLPEATKIGDYDMGLLAYAGVPHFQEQFFRRDSWPSEPDKLQLEIVERLSRELELGKSELAIFSFEGLLMAPKKEIDKVIHLLSQFFEEIFVYAVIKRQDRWAISNYTTRLRNLLTTESNVLKDENGHYYDHNFSNAIGRWRQVVGKKNVIVDAIEDHSDIVNRFRDTFELVVQPRVGERHNTGMSAHGQEVFRVFNEMCSDHHNWRSNAIWIKDKIKEALPVDEPQLPSKESVERYLENFIADHANLYGSVLPPNSKFFSEKYEFPNLESRPEVSRAEVEILVESAMKR